MYIEEEGGRDEKDRKDKKDIIPFIVTCHVHCIFD